FRNSFFKIKLIVECFLLQLNVDEAEIARRRALWTQPAPRYTRGVLAKFARNAAGASRGAVLDLYED
ncbi:MAG: dihydroxy-acid dehydratase, partial [Congregibacter sp.]|nr:dihydroxy-acid dehydratase [Congregibacter sp.]